MSMLIEKFLECEALLDLLEDNLLNRIELEVRLAHAEMYRQLARGRSTPRRGEGSAGEGASKRKDKAVPDLFPFLHERLRDAAAVEMELFRVNTNALMLTHVLREREER